MSRREAGTDTGLQFLAELFEKFLIFHQPYHDRIEILRVLHGAQDLMAQFNREGIDY